MLRGRRECSSSSRAALIGWSRRRGLGLVQWEGAALGCLPEAKFGRLQSLRRSPKEGREEGARCRRREGERERVSRRRLGSAFALGARGPHGGLLLAAAGLFGAEAGPRDRAPTRRRRGRAGPRGGRRRRSRRRRPRPQELPVALHLLLLLPRLPHQHRGLRLLRHGLKQLYPRRHRRVKTTGSHCTVGCHCIYFNWPCDDWNPLHSPFHYVRHLKAKI